MNIGSQGASSTTRFARQVMSSAMPRRDEKTPMEKLASFVC